MGTFTLVVSIDGLLRTETVDAIDISAAQHILENRYPAETVVIIDEIIQ